MILENKKLKLISTTHDDPDIKEQLQKQSFIHNLTEVRQYAQPMPAEIIFRIEADDRLIGEVALKSIKWYNRKAEISIFIFDDYQKKGFGKSALRLMMDYVFNTMNFHRLEAEVMAFNEEGKHIFEEAGFILEGSLREAKYLNGRYYDILRYGLLRRECSADI